MIPYQAKCYANSLISSIVSAQKRGHTTAVEHFLNELKALIKKEGLKIEEINYNDLGSVLVERIRNGQG